MNFQKYRLSIALVILSLFTAGIVLRYSGSVLENGWNIWNTLFDLRENSTHESQLPIVRESIPITHLSSKRYFYTLKKELDAKLREKYGTSLMGTTPYENFGNIFISGSNFVFEIQDQSIEIPASSYFFNIWNTKAPLTVSGEIGTKSADTGKKDKNTIALTFDDGPSKQYTDTLLDILKQEGVHATFYVLGSRVSEYPDIVKREYREGHEIGNHSYSHTLLTSLTEEAMQEELYKTDQAIYQAIGTYPRTFRPPYGSVSSGILEKAAMPAILWSIDPRDWKTHSIRKNIASMDIVKEGDIIIMHDIHKTSVESIQEIIQRLKKRGFTFVTVSELLSLSREHQELGKKCTKKGSCK